jgi:rRNA maturation RNase YbeY
MIHGTLHLCGYDDKTEEERFEMQKREDKWLKEFNMSE